MIPNIRARLGGALPVGADPLLAAPRKLPEDVLCFSHGRSAIIWAVQNQGPFQSAAVCAYTWPAIPRALRRYGLHVSLFDFGESDIDRIIDRAPGRCLVLVPVFYGFEPWIDYIGLADAFPQKVTVMLDAAQSAFGFEDYDIPSRGTILSCPHKATSLNDGAVLKVHGLSVRQKTEHVALKRDTEFRAIKERGRILLDTGKPEDVQEGLRLLGMLEETWPSDPPQGMTSESERQLHMVDPVQHARLRRENHDHLAERLADVLPPLEKGAGTPFAYPTLVNDRDNVLRALHKRSVFATALWHDAPVDPAYPVTADRTKRLLALPIDQRYRIEDMDRQADIVIDCLRNDI